MNHNFEFKAHDIAVACMKIADKYEDNPTLAKEYRKMAALFNSQPYEKFYSLSQHEALDLELVNVDG
jgi:hypothetical protein